MDGEAPDQDRSRRSRCITVMPREFITLGHVSIATGRVSQAWLFPVTGWTSDDPSSFLCDMEKYNTMYERSIGPNRETFWAE